MAGGHDDEVGCEKMLEWRITQLDAGTSVVGRSFQGYLPGLGGPSCVAGNAGVIYENIERRS